MTDQVTISRLLSERRRNHLWLNQLQRHLFQTPVALDYMVLCHIPNVVFFPTQEKAIDYIADLKVNDRFPAVMRYRKQDEVVMIL